MSASEPELAILARKFGDGENPMMKRGYEQCMARINKAPNAVVFLIFNNLSATDPLLVGAIAWMREEFPRDPVYGRYVERMTARSTFKRGMAKDVD